MLRIGFRLFGVDAIFPAGGEKRISAPTIIFLSYRTTNNVVLLETSRTSIICTKM